MKKRAGFDVVDIFFSWIFVEFSLFLSHVLHGDVTLYVSPSRRANIIEIRPCRQLSSMANFLFITDDP